MIQCETYKNRSIRHRSNTQKGLLNSTLCVCVRKGYQRLHRVADDENLKAVQKFSRWKGEEGHTEKREGQGQLHET